MKKINEIRQWISDLLYPLNTTKSLIAILSIGVTIWTIGMIVNLNEPNYIVWKSVDQMFLGDKIMAGGVLVFIAYMLIWLMGKSTKQKDLSVKSKSLGNEIIVEHIDAIKGSDLFWWVVSGVLIVSYVVTQQLGLSSLDPVFGLPTIPCIFIAMWKSFKMR